MVLDSHIYLYAGKFVQPVSAPEGAEFRSEYRKCYSLLFFIQRYICVWFLSGRKAFRQRGEKKYIGYRVPFLFDRLFWFCAGK